jgi:RimJ/RimL family protein N-acetyltransferase
MSTAIPPAIPSGSLAASAQPSLTSGDGELLLRPWRRDDAATLRAAYQDPLIQRWHTRHAASPQEAQEWISAYGRDWQREQGAHWAITHAAGGEILGRMAVRSMDFLDGDAECAYWVLPSARGAGVAPRALDAVARWALDAAGFHRLSLEHSVGNERSCRVATRAGFGLEGTMRGAHLHADGWHDVHLHARLQGDTAPDPDA